jgi:hypothetical protein
MQAETISEVKIYEEDIEYIENRSCMVGIIIWKMEIQVTWQMIGT